MKLNIPQSIQVAKLAQSGRHQSESQEVLGSIPTGGNFFLLNLFCSPPRKPLLPTLPTSRLSCLYDPSYHIRKLYIQIKKFVVRDELLYSQSYNGKVYKILDKASKCGGKILKSISR